MSNINLNLDDILIESIIKYQSQITLSVIIFITSLINSNIIFPRLFSSLIDNVVNGKKGEFGYASIIVTLSPYILSEILTYIADNIDTYYLPKIEFEIIEKLSRQVLESAKLNGIKINTTELTLNLKKILDLRSIYHLTLVYIMPMILLSVTLGIYFFNANKKLGMLSIIILIITFFIILYLSIDCTTKSVASEENTIAYCDDISDIFLNIDNVISAGMNKVEINRIASNGIVLHNDFVKREQCNSNLKFISAMMYFGVMIGLNGFSLKLFYEGVFDKTTLMTIFFMVLNLVQHCDSMIYEMHNITHSIGKYKELKKYFSQFKIANVENSCPEIKIINHIKFVNVTIYNDNKPILKNINCVINGSQKVAIIGNIGSGKTSLMKALIGLLKYEGKIKINDIDINELGKKFISKNIAYIPQNPRLFNRTIRENLAYGSHYTSNEIDQLLSLFKLNDFFLKFENGLDTNVGTNGDKLSGGQRQLVYIVRAIIQNKKIFVLDEPTSSLDEAHKNILFQLLNTQSNSTIIAITHDKEILNWFDSILTIAEGKIKMLY